MSDLFIPPETLADHLAHIVEGQSMREIARGHGCDASTVMRRLNRIEESRDHPEVDAVLTALEQYREKSESRAMPDRAYVAAALGLDVGRVHTEFAKLVQAMMGDSVTILMGDMPKAGMVVSGRPSVPLAREIALAALAFGWITPKGSHTGPVRKFAAARALMECTQAVTPKPAAAARSGYSCERPIDALFRRRNQTLITADHVKLANDFHEVYALRETATSEAFRHLQASLSPRTLTLLEAICGKHTGFETVEKSMGLPARSAKALIAFALDAYSHARAA